MDAKPNADEMSTLEAAPIDAAKLPVIALRPQPPRRSRLRAVLFACAAMLLVAGGSWAAWRYWTQWRFQETTDDAYVQADIVIIAPKISGYLKTVGVADNQPVKRGDVLATIDPRDYEAAVEQAKADVAEAQASIDSASAQIVEQQALIDQAAAAVASDKANEVFAEQNSRRYDTLARSGYGSQQDAQQATAAIGSAKAVVAKDEAALAAAQKQVATLEAQLAEAKATLAHNQAVLDQAQLNLGYTTLRAPVDGVVGQRTLRVGQYVQPGTNLLAVVPLQATYVVANYEETQLTDVVPGQAVSISVDRFPERPVRGVVDSLAPASGQQFALLPPDNATGNFTKIVQRIPVKITLDPADPLAGRLLPGMSVTTTIDLRTPAGARAGAAAK